jgi:hypothetical protein
MTIELIVEGKGMEPMLREMERSPDIRVIGPHISSRYLGAGVEGQRTVIRVKAEDAAEAREIVRRYLPPDSGHIIKPALG